MRGGKMNRCGTPTKSGKRDKEPQKTKGGRPARQVKARRNSLFVLTIPGTEDSLTLKLAKKKHQNRTSKVVSVDS